MQGPAASSTPAPAVSIEGLTVSYGTTAVLWDVSAQLAAGRLSAIVGPNGAGKSTLLAATLGLVPADAGTVRLLGQPIRSGRRQVAFVPQRETVDWDFPITVREVVEMGRFPHRGWLRRLTAADHAAVDHALERAGIAHLAGRQVGALSGGQRQRTFVARALAQQAPILMLDEPFTGIDARTEQDLMAVFRELADAGSAVVAVHHDINAVRRSFDDALLLNLRSISTGPVGEALRDEHLHEAYGAVPGSGGS